KALPAPAERLLSVLQRGRPGLRTIISAEARERARLISKLKACLTRRLKWEELPVAVRAAHEVERAGTRYSSHAAKLTTLLAGCGLRGADGDVLDQRQHWERTVRTRADRGGISAE